jgi:hypothetical protein
MIEELGKGNQRSEVKILAEGSISQIDEDGFVVFKIELTLLQNRIQFLAFLKLIPLLLKRLQVQSCCRDHG